MLAGRVRGPTSRRDDPFDRLHQRLPVDRLRHVSRATRLDGRSAVRASSAGWAPARPPGGAAPPRPTREDPRPAAVAAQQPAYEGRAKGRCDASSAARLSRAVATPPLSGQRLGPVNIESSSKPLVGDRHSCPKGPCGPNINGGPAHRRHVDLAKESPSARPGQAPSGRSSGGLLDLTGWHMRFPAASALKGPRPCRTHVLSWQRLDGYQPLTISPPLGCRTCPVMYDPSVEASKR